MEGLIKFVVDADSGKILGTHILGQSAGELIHIANLARNAGEGNTDPFFRTIFIHPTLMEGVQSSGGGDLERRHADHDPMKP